VLMLEVWLKCYNVKTFKCRKVGIAIWHNFMQICIWVKLPMVRCLGSPEHKLLARRATSGIWFASI